jgi:hypothetical protein
VHITECDVHVLVSLDIIEMHNLKSALVFFLITCILVLGVLGCERSQKPLANIEPEGNAPAYQFEANKNVPPGGVERP